MEDNLGYPLIHAEKDDPAWGSRIQLRTEHANPPYRSKNDEYDGWYWLVPPKEPLPDSFDMKPKGAKKRFRSSIGYVYPKEDGTNPIETAVCVVLCADLTIEALPVKTAKKVFIKWEAMAISADNRGKLFDLSVPILPPSVYKTASQKYKYHYLQENFSQAKVSGIPDLAYVKATPQAIPPNQLKEMSTSSTNNFSFDVERIFNQNLEPFDAPLKDDIAPHTAIKKRTAPEPVETPKVRVPPTPPLVQPEPEVEAPAKKPRKAPAKTAAPKATGRSKKQATPAAPPPPPVPSPEPEPVQVTVVRAPEVGVKPVQQTGPANKDNVIQWIRKIIEDVRFAKVRQNPLADVPIEVGKEPTKPETRALLLDFARFADQYLSKEWALNEPKQNSILDDIFGTSHK